MCFLAG
jgi:hypothetical protein